MRKSIFATLMALLALSSSAADKTSSDKWYSIRCGSKALIIENASMKNSSPIVLWTPTDVPSQLWQVETGDDGTVCLREAYMGRYLCSASAAAAGVKITARNSSAKSRYGNWQLLPVEGKTDTYNILSKDGTLMIAASETADGVQPALVDATAQGGKCEWTLKEYADEVPTAFNTAVRDRIVDDFIAHYYHTATGGAVLGEGGWWGDAEMFETILDCFETTGDKKYQTYWTKLRSNFTNRNKTDWSGNDYNDDITWMVLACIRAYKYFGASVDLQYARDNFQRMWDRALEPSGTLRWRERNNGTAYGSNSCINCPAINAACYLYDITGEQQYLDNAEALWEAQYNNLCDKNDGHVWDSGSWDNTWTTFTVGNYWGSTYNQGTMLGACVNLYRITGKEKYKAYADKVWNWTYNSLCSNNAANQHIVNACQTAVGDLCGFKGILMRYCRLYAEEMDHEEVLQWMEDNAWFARQNANSKGIVWSKWLTKTPENFKSVEDGVTKDFTNDAFGASTVVSVAFNAHVNRVFHKDAFTTIGAEMFDDIRDMQISDTPDDGDTPNTTRTKNGWICFKNVQFGNADGATECQLRLHAAADGATFSVYLDSISPESKIATVSLQQGWNTYTVSIPRTTGSHKVIAAAESTVNTMFHNISFANPASSINAVPAARQASKAAYNIAGQCVADRHAGIVITGGKKYLMR